MQPSNHTENLVGRSTHQSPLYNQSWKIARAAGEWGLPQCTACRDNKGPLRSVEHKRQLSVAALVVVVCGWCQANFKRSSFRQPLYITTIVSPSSETIEAATLLVLGNTWQNILEISLKSYLILRYLVQEVYLTINTKNNVCVCRNLTLNDILCIK